MNHCRGWERRKADLTPSHPAPCPCVTRLRSPGAAGPRAAAADDDDGGRRCPESFPPLRPPGSWGLFPLRTEPRPGQHVGSEITSCFYFLFFFWKAHRGPVDIAKGYFCSSKTFGLFVCLYCVWGGCFVVFFWRKHPSTYQTARCPVMSRRI